MNLLHTVSVKNIKEIEVLTFLLLRDARISSDAQKLMIQNNAKFYNVFESENFDNDGQYTVLASNVNRLNGQVLNISEYINL